MQAGFTGNWGMPMTALSVKIQWNSTVQKIFWFLSWQIFRNQIRIACAENMVHPRHSCFWNRVFKNHRRKGGFCKTGWGHHSRSHARQACRYFHYERRRRVISAKPFTHIYSSFPFCGNCMYRPAPLVPCRLPRFRPTPPFSNFLKAFFRRAKSTVFQSHIVQRFS